MPKSFKSSSVNFRNFSNSIPWKCFWYLVNFSSSKISVTLFLGVLVNIGGPINWAKTEANLSCPFSLARWNAVCPLDVLKLGSDPDLIKSSTNRSCPNWAANINGVNSSFVFTITGCPNKFWLQNEHNWSKNYINVLKNSWKYVDILAV